MPQFDTHDFKMEIQAGLEEFDGGQAWNSTSFPATRDEHEVAT